MADEITPAEIVEAATGAQSFTSDGQTATAHPLPDMIEAAKFAAAQKSKKKQGIKFLKMVPPTARGDDS